MTTSEAAWFMFLVASLRLSLCIIIIIIIILVGIIALIFLRYIQKQGMS